jgi:TetR/AcrR family transcriptional repressor of nem operon
VKIVARPKAFDRQEALQKAMKTFWEKGYDGTNTFDLVAAMNISRSSLYETFGDKQTLFLEALDCYGQFINQKRSAIFNNAKTIKQGFADFFEETIAIALDDDYPGGCFFVNTAISLPCADEKVRSAIVLGAKKLEEEFVNLIEKGKLSGEFCADKDSRAIARLFLGLLCGMNVVARIQKDRAILADMTKAALESLT